MFFTARKQSWKSTRTKESIDVPEAFTNPRCPKGLSNWKAELTGEDFPGESGCLRGFVCYYSQSPRGTSGLGPRLKAGVFYTKGPLIDQSGWYPHPSLPKSLTAWETPKDHLLLGLCVQCLDCNRPNKGWEPSDKKPRSWQAKYLGQGHPAPGLDSLSGVLSAVSTCLSSWLRSHTPTSHTQIIALYKALILLEFSSQNEN